MYALFYGWLAETQQLRQGPYYFGEFLSQGALDIEGHCSIDSMRKIIDTGIFRFRPE